MIQPEPEDLPKDNPKLEIAVLSFQDEHNMRSVGQTPRSQDVIDVKDNVKGSKSRSQNMKEQAYNKEQRERPRPHELNDKSNLIDLMKEWILHALPRLHEVSTTQLQGNGRSCRVDKMIPEEEDQVEKFIRGLPDNIQGNGYAVKNAKNKRRLEVNKRDNRGQQPPFKRPNVGGQNVTRAYTADNNERKSYNGPLPLYNKCKLYHEGPCTMRYGKCNKVGHLTRDCKVTSPDTST
ncbi:hypothetical protein Tco_0305181 [Tanacetum coccineum]